MADNSNLVENLARPLTNGTMTRAEVVSQFNHLHRCIQSALIRGAVLPIIKAMAEAYENGWYDDRNVNASKTCAFLWNAYKNETGVDTPCLM